MRSKRCVRYNYDCNECDLNTKDCYLERCNYFGYDKRTFNLAYSILEKETVDSGYRVIVAKKYFHIYGGFDRLYGEAKIKLRSEKIKSIL